MQGAVRSCLRVGELAPGPYHVVLEQVLSSHVAGGSGAAKGAALAVQVTPASGPPGATVTVTGTMAQAPSPPPTYANACWDGCRDGLRYTGVRLRWTSATTFETTVVVPGGPWIEASPPRVSRPHTGSYHIGLQCVGVQSGCGLGGAQGSAVFHLQVPTPPKSSSWCLNGSDCARLAATPSQARPGDVVKITGEAPLVSIIGPDQPFDFQFQVVPGAPHGSEVRFVKPNGGGTLDVDLGDGSLTVIAPPKLASLPSTVPVTESTDGLTPIAAEAGDPSVVAWCDPGHVTVDGPGGRKTVTLAGTGAVLQQLGFGLLGATIPQCVAVAPLADPNGGPPAVAAAFLAAPHHEAPPADDVALETTDGGATWSPVPVPEGAGAGTFGGFTNDKATTEALFAPSPSTSGAEPSRSAVPLVEATSDGGGSWHSTTLGCPGSGPCVRFGAFFWGNCAMNGTTQGLLRSTDAGRQWSRAGWPGSVEACMPATLGAVSPTGELFADSGSRYLVLDSTDAGAHWQVLGIPAIPGHRPSSGFDPDGGGLVLLPDGALLAWSNSGNPVTVSWVLLTSGAHRWCSATASFTRSEPVTGTGTGEFIATAWPVVLGSQLWWQTISGDGNDGDTGVVTHHIELSAIGC